MYSIGLASQTQPPLAWIALSMLDTESDSHWGWLGLVCDITCTENRVTTCGCAHPSACYIHDCICLLSRGFPLDLLARDTLHTIESLTVAHRLIKCSLSCVQYDTRADIMVTRCHISVIQTFQLSKDPLVPTCLDK